MKTWLLGLLFCASAAHAEKTFVYCSEAGPSTFNPQMADDGPTFNASSSMLYNRLVEFEDGSTKVVPALAESWSISKDGKSYTRQSTGREFIWDFAEEARRIREVIPGLPIPAAQFEEIIATCRDLEKEPRADKLVRLTLKKA